MTETVRHKNYTAKIEYSNEDECYIGEVIGIKTPMAFHGDTVEETKNAFKELIDFYLKVCEEDGTQPDTPAIAQAQATLQVATF